MEKIEGVVKKVLKKILKETYDMYVFDELTMFREQLKNKRCDYLEEIPLFAKLSFADMKEAQNLLREKLVKELNNDGNSFLKTMTIIYAIETLGYSTPKSGTNKKVKICYEIWKGNLDNEFKIISLLDQI